MLTSSSFLAQVNNSGICAHKRNRHSFAHQKILYTFFVAHWFSSPVKHFFFLPRKKRREKSRGTNPGNEQISRCPPSFCLQIILHTERGERSGYANVVRTK